MTHISSPLEECCFGCFDSICGRVGRIDGDPAHIGNVMFGHEGVFILCYCDGRINDILIIIPIGVQVFFNLSFVFFWSRLAALILN